jgi:C2 domain
MRTYTQVGRTRSLEQTSAPQWGEMFAFRVSLACRVADYVVLQVFDKRSNR